MKSASRIAMAFATATVALSGCAILGMSDMSNTEVRVTLSGANEVPQVATSASGGGTLFVAADRSISGGVTTTGITGTMAHIHIGAAGKNGPVIVPLKKNGDNGWAVPADTKFTNAQFESFKSGELYINVHSAAHPGGEIRGQLLP